jgi:hypothetical protein
MRTPAYASKCGGLEQSGGLEAALKDAVWQSPQHPACRPRPRITTNETHQNETYDYLERGKLLK